MIETARKWIGVPFHPQGRTMAGVDCIGFPLTVTKTCGLGDHDSHRFRAVRFGVYLSIRDMGREMSRVCGDPIFDVYPADLLFMRVHSRGEERDQHLAIWTGNTIIHVDAKRGVVEVPLEDAEDVLCGYRIPGVPEWQA